MWREIFVYRARRMVHVYRIESHGRRFYRSLEYTSDARFCLREMQPSTRRHRKLLWPHWERHGAGHPYADSHNQSEVGGDLARLDRRRQPLARHGDLPAERGCSGACCRQALLESHEFWQDEDDNVRGYPRDENASTDVIYIRLGVGAHVAFHGARFDRVRVGGESLPPTRALVLRLKKSRLSAQRDATMAAIRALEDFTREKALLSEPFTANFMVCKALAAILRRLAGHSFGQAASARRREEAAKKKKAEAEVALAGQLEDLLHQVELTPFARRRRLARPLAHRPPRPPRLRRHPRRRAGGRRRRRRRRLRRQRAQVAVAPASRACSTATKDAGRDGGPRRGAAAPSAAATHDADGGGGGAGAGGGVGRRRRRRRRTSQEEELVLLDLLHAPPNSYLYHLANVLVRIENLSHVLAWARFDESTTLTLTDAARAEPGRPPRRHAAAAQAHLRRRGAVDARRGGAPVLGRPRRPLHHQRAQR